MKQIIIFVELVLLIFFVACATTSYKTEKISVQSYDARDLIPASLADYNAKVAGFIDAVTQQTLEDGKVPEGAADFAATIVPAAAPNIKKNRQEKNYYNRSYKSYKKDPSAKQGITRQHEIRQSWAKWRRANPTAPAPNTIWPPNHTAINWRPGDTGGKKNKKNL